MTSRYASKNNCLSLGVGDDEQQEEANAEFVEQIAALDGGEDGVSIEPLTVFSQAGMTNKETTADLASNVTVTSGDKCNTVPNETPQLSVHSDIIWGDDSDYRCQEDTVDQKGRIASCCNTHILEKENDARWTSSNHPEDLNSVYSLQKSASSLRQSLPGIGSPSPNGAVPHCETRTVSEEAGLSTPEACSSGQFPMHDPNLEETTEVFKKSQGRNKGISDNDSIKNNVTGSQSADFESCVSVSLPHCNRESSLGSSNIMMSTHDCLALASVQSADGDSSRIFTPDVASSKGICSQARVAGRGGYVSQIPDYPRRFKQDSLFSPGSTSQSDNKILIPFPQQHSSNNCLLISAGNDLSPSCEYFGGSSDNVSTIRSHSQDKDGNTWNLRDAEPLDKEHSHPCHFSDLYDSRACLPVTCYGDEGHESSNQDKLEDDRKIQTADAVTGHRHILQHKRGCSLQDDLWLTSKFQAFSSPARTAIKPACRRPLQPESSASRFLLSSSYSSPDIVNSEGSGSPLLNTDTNNECHNNDYISIQAREERLQTRHHSVGGQLESGAFQLGVSAEGIANIGTNLSCSLSAVNEIHPFFQGPCNTDSSISANAGFTETSSTGHNYMRFQGSNNNLYSRLGNPNSDNPSPRISRSTISRFFDQQPHASSPDVSLRKCSSCSNVDFSHSLRSTTHQGAPEADNEDDLLSENQPHPETTSQPEYSENGDIFDSLLSVLVDKAVSDQNINRLSSATQEDNNDCKRSVLFFKDAQRKYICEDGNHTESNRNTLSGRIHKKNVSHGRTYNTDRPNIPMSNSTAKPRMAQVYTEAQPCLTAPVIRITASTLSGDASQSLSADTIAQTALLQSSSSPAPGIEIYSAVNASHKPRVSFINGLRRLSREKTAFLRVEHPCSNTLRTPSRATQCVEKQDEYEAGRAGKRFGRENKRRLKVEFAVMDTDSDQLAHNKRSGNIGGGFLSIKDDVENDVAMLGGGGGRFRHPRVSLLGKPLNYKAHRRDVSYRRLQARVYNFLERPKSWQSWIYHLAMFLFVLVCLTLGVLSSITEFEKLLIQYAVYLEIVMLLWIVLELGLRVWSAGCRSRYQGQSGRLRFLRRPLCIIDMILVLASVSSLIVGSTQEHFSQAVLSGLRFFQILRMVRMDRKGGTWKLLGSVVWAHRQELVTTLYIGLLGLVFSSYFVYLAEKDEPRLENSPKGQFNHTEYKPKFSNFADAIWWGVVTLCTVGYGDVVPATWGGKVIASFSAILGISFFALPAGILGSGFALKVQQQQRQKHLNRRRIPAANLIQCLWRCYAADELSMSTATWKRHLIPCPSPPSERTFKNNTSFVSRFSTRRRDRSNATGSFSRDGIQSQSPMSARHHSRRAAISTSEEEVTTVLDRSHLCLATGASEQKYQLDPLPFKKENSVSSIGKESEEEDLSPRLTQLTEQHKRVIRVIRKIRYFVSRRKFREALRPYDVKDVIEQYSAGHIDMLARIKNLQGRLDQILGRQGSKSKDVYESKICLASRIVKVERQVEDIETKLDMLLDMYKDDRKLLLQHLNISQKGAIQGGPSHPPPPPPAPSSQFKPRPILIDKQFTSEPATPTGIGFASSPRGRLHGIKPVIQRNLSDLSQRIKKRVTYRGLYLQDPPSRAQSAANFASIQPSTFPGATPMPTATSPDEMSSTTVSETTRDESSENIISLNDVDLPLIMGTTITTGDSPPEASSSAQAGSSDSAAFFNNSNLYQSLKSIQQNQMSSSPLNSPLIRVKILSTLNEQQSLESDTSQSCASSSPPTPPTNKNAADISSTTPPSSAHQSPLIQRQRHLSGTDSSSQRQKSSPLSSRRPHKPILRLPSTLALTVTSSEDFTTTDTSPQSLTTSNFANSSQDVFFQTEDTSKLCNLDDESTEIAGVTNRSCKTSEL